MTDDLPRGSFPSLPPPEGAYDAVTRRAAARRWRRAGLSGALALPVLAAAVLVATTLGGGSGDDALVAAPPSPSPSATSEPSPEPSGEASPEPVASPGPAVLPTLQPVQPVQPEPTTPVPDPEPVYEGRVVDRAGRPVAGAWLIRALPSGLQAERIGADGRYAGRCGGPRELVAMWDVSLRSERTQPRGMRNLAATWVNGGRTQAGGQPVPCGDAVVTTVLDEGGTVTGRIRFVDDQGREREYADGADPGGGLYCRALGISVQMGQCADWDPVDGRYRFAGLPTGGYQLLGMYGGGDVEVTAGRTVELDWWECTGCAGRSPAPTPPPSPAPPS